MVPCVETSRQVCCDPRVRDQDRSPVMNSFAESRIGRRGRLCEGHFFGRLARHGWVGRSRRVARSPEDRFRPVQDDFCGTLRRTLPRRAVFRRPKLQRLVVYVVVVIVVDQTDLLDHDLLRISSGSRQNWARGGTRVPEFRLLGRWNLRPWRKRNWSASLARSVRLNIWRLHVETT